MILLIVTMACWGLSQYAYLGLYVTYLRQVQGFPLDQAALVATTAGWISYASAFVVGWTSDQIGRRRTLLITGSLGVLVGIPLFTLTSSFWLAVILGALFGIGNGSFFGLGVAYAQDMARAHNLGGRSGMTTGAGHIMSGLAGFVAAWIASTFGGFQWVGLEVTLLSVVMVTCMYFTRDRAYEARRAERRAQQPVVAAEA